MEVDQLPDGRPLAQLSLAEIKEQCALRNLPKNGSRKDLTDRLKLRLELEKLREEASRALAKEDVVPNIGLQDTPVGQSDIVRQYLEAQQRRLLLFGVHRPHFENTTPIQETTPSDERKRPVAQKTKGSLKQSDLLGTTPGATRDLLANADGLLDDLEETTSSIKATRGRSANHKLKVDETPSRKKTRYNSSDATNSISRTPEETTPLTAKRRRIVRGSPVQPDGQQTPTAPIELSPHGTETKEVKRGRGRPRKIKENPPAIVFDSATVAAQDGLTNPKVELSAPAQAQPAVKADADKKPIVLVPEKEDNRSARAKRLRSQEETPQTLQERARVPPPANSADPALSEVSLEDPIEAALLAMHGAENATKSPKRRSLPLESLDDERSRAQESEESDNSRANMSLDGPVELARPKTQPEDVLENGDMLPRSATATAPDPSTAESAANRERSKVAKPARSKEVPPVAKEALKVVEHRVELLEGKESKEVFAKKSTPIPGSPRQEVKRTGGNDRTVRETRKRTKVENIVQKLTQDKVEAADIAAKEASLAKRPRKENGQTDNSKVPDASPPSSGISPDDCVLRLLGAGPKLEKSDKRAHDTPKSSKEKKPVSGSPRDKKAKEVAPTLSSPTSRRSRRGLSGEGVDVKSESDADAAATIDPAESGRRDSVEAAVAALIGEPLEPRPVEDTASKRATRKTSRDMKVADEHQQQNLHQQPQEQQQQQRQQSLPATVSQPSTRSSRSLRSRETSTEAETVVTDRPQVSPLREEKKPEHESPVVEKSRASAQEKPEVESTPAVEISQAIVEVPVPSKLEQVVAKCETRRTSARQNSSDSKQSKIVEHIKVEQSIKLDPAIAESTAAKQEQPATSAGKPLEVAAPPLVDERVSTEQTAIPAPSASDLPKAEEPPADKKDDAKIAEDSEREKVRSLPEQTTHNSATATVASSSTELGTKPEASEKTTQNDEADEDLDALKIVENDEQPDAQQSQKTECDVTEVKKSSDSKEGLAKDLGEALPTKDQKSLEVAQAATENLEGKDEKKAVDCEVVEKVPETEPAEQISALLEGNKDIASDIEQEVSSKPQPEQDDLWEAVFCGDQEGNPSADWPEGNNNEDPSSSYRQSDLLDDSETNISDTPGIKLPHKFQPNVESAVASILDLNDIMRPSSSLSSHGGQNDNETAVMDNVPDADSAVAGLLSEVPFDDEGDHADLCIDDEVVSEAVPQGYEETAAEYSAGVFDQEPNPPAVGEALQEISTCKETPERRISEEVRSVTGDVVESVATASLLVDMTEQQQQTTSSPRATEQTSSAPLGACSPSKSTEIPPAQPPVKSPTPGVATDKLKSDVKSSVNLSEESSSDSDSEDSSARSKSRIKQKEKATGQVPSNAKLESESSKRKTPVSQTSKASTSRKLSDDSRVGKESSSSSSSSSSGQSSSESSSSDDDDAGSGNSVPRKATPKSLAPVRDDPKSSQATKKKQPGLSLKPEKRSKQKHSTHKEESSESVKVQSEEKSSQQKDESEHQERVKRDQLQRNQDAETEKPSETQEKPAEVPRKERDDGTEQKEDENRLREQKEDQEKLRREREAAEEVQKQRDAEEARKQSEAAERALKQLEEEENLRKQSEADEMARKQLEEEEKARKQLEEEENARKKLEDEANARKKLEEEANARKQLEEEKARKKLEEEERARKQLEKEEKARQQQEEMEKARKQREEEEKARKQLEEEERVRKQEEEEKRLREQQEAEKVRKQQEEEKARKKQEEEKARKQQEEEKLRKQQEEEKLRKQQEEEKLKKQQEEEKLKKQQEEEKEKKRLEAEELKKQLEEERAKKQKESEEKLRKEEEAEKLRKQEQEAEKLRKEKEEEDLRKRKAAEEAKLREEEAAKLRKQKEEEELRKQEEEEKLRRAQEEERAKRLKEEEEKLREQEQAERRSQKLKEEEMQKKRNEEEKRALEEQRSREEKAEKERKEKEENSRKQEEKDDSCKKQEGGESSRKQQSKAESLQTSQDEVREDNRADDESSQRLSARESEGQREADNRKTESQKTVESEEPPGAAIEPAAKASCSSAPPAARASTSSEDTGKAGSHVHQPSESNRDPVASGMMVGSKSQQRKNPLVSYGFDSEDEDDDKDDEGSDDDHEVANASEAVAKDNASKGDGEKSDHDEVSGAAPKSPVERCQDAAESSADLIRVNVAAAKSEDSGGVQVSSSHTTGIFTHSVASPGMVGGLKKFEVTSSSDNSAENRPEASHARPDASSGVEGESSADEVCDVDQGSAAQTDCSQAANQAETASSSDESARSLDEGSQSRLHSQSMESASSSAEMTSSTDRSKNQNPQDGASSSSDGLKSDSAARAAPDETDQKTCVASSSPTQTTDGGGSSGGVTEQPSQLPSSDDACSSSDKLPKVEHDDPAADTSTSCQDLRTEVQSSSEAGSEKLHDASSSSDKKDSTDSYADSSSPQHTMTTSNDRVESRTDGEGAPSSSDQQTGTADSQIENSGTAEEPDSEPVRASVESSEEASSPDYSSVDASDDPTRPKCCSSSTASTERNSAPVEEFESGRPRCESTSETNRTSRIDDDDDFEENSQPELPGACTSSHSQQHSNQHAVSEQADVVSNAADEDIDISSSNNNNNANTSSNSSSNNSSSNNNNSSSSDANNPATSEAGSSAEVDAARNPLSRPVEKTSISSSDVQPSQRSADFSLDESSGMAQSSDEPRAQMLASPLQDYGAIPDGNEVSASSSSSSATGESHQANPSSSGDKDSPAPTPSSSSCKPEMKLSSSSSVEDASSEAIPMGVEHTKDGEDQNAESPSVEENADSSQEDENPSSSSTAPSNRESKEPSSN